MKVNALRHELRKSLSDSDFEKLRQWIAEDGWEMLSPRRVHSLLYESTRCQPLDKKRRSSRERFTIEYYNEDMEHISLLKKSRRKDCYIKKVSPLSRHACGRILSGDIEGLHGEKDPLIFEFYNRIKMGDLREWMLADYTVEKFLRRDGAVQISFESDFQTGVNTNDFLNARHPAAKKPGPVIFEVKYDEALPEAISRYTGNRRKAEAFAFASVFPAF